MIRIEKEAGSKYQLVIYIPKWAVLVPALLCIGAISFCCFYLLHSRDYLISWYQHLNSCLYKASQWPELFFTDAVKSAGNKYCIAALPLCVAFLLFLYKAEGSKKWRDRIAISIEKNDLIFIVVLMIIYFAIWTYGFLCSYPSNDETFSAVNCARIHPFQTLSYYMIPNNHVLFNLVNSLPAHLSDNLLSSGRIISGFASLLVVPMLYLWLRSKGLNGYVAMLFSVVVMLQFPVWAFSFQARGYSIYYLSCWGSIIFTDYYFKTKSRSALVWQGYFWS